MPLIHPPPRKHIYFLYSKTGSSLSLPPNFYQDFFKEKKSQHHDFPAATERRIKWKGRDKEWNAENIHVGQNMISDSKYKPQAIPITFSGGCFFLPPFLFSPSSPLLLHHSPQACNLGVTSQCPLVFPESSQSPQPVDSSWDIPFTILTLCLAKCRHVIFAELSSVSRYFQVFCFKNHYEKQAIFCLGPDLNQWTVKKKKC